MRGSEPDGADGDSCCLSCLPAHSNRDAFRDVG
jgi:hypothetical protein